MLFFFTVYSGLEQSTWTKHTPPKTARKWTNITLEPTKTRVSENKRERGRRRRRGGGGGGLLGAGDESGSCKLHLKCINFVLLAPSCANDSLKKDERLSLQR